MQQYETIYKKTNSTPKVPLGLVLDSDGANIDDTYTDTQRTDFEGSPLTDSGQNLNVMMAQGLDLTMPQKAAAAEDGKLGHPYHDDDYEMEETIPIHPGKWGNLSKAIVRKYLNIDDSLHRKMLAEIRRIISRRIESHNKKCLKQADRESTRNGTSSDDIISWTGLTWNKLPDNTRHFIMKRFYNFYETFIMEKAKRKPETRNVKNIATCEDD